MPKLANSRDGKKQHIQRRWLASGWTLTKKRRKEIKEKNRGRKTADSK